MNIPDGFYIEGCLSGGVIKQSISVRYDAEQTQSGRWRVARMRANSRGILG